MELTKEQIFKLYEAVGYIKDLCYYTPEPNHVIVNFPTGLKLRKFEDMTKEELKVANNYEYIPDYLHHFLYLLTIGIDLFGAIEKGYAERIEK